MAEESVIEEELYIIADFPYLDNKEIFTSFSKESSASGIPLALELSDLQASNPKAMVQQRLEFTGTHEINLGTVLIFEEKREVGHSGSVEYVGSSINRLEFLLSQVKNTEPITELETKNNEESRNSSSSGTH